MIKNISLFGFLFYSLNNNNNNNNINNNNNNNNKSDMNMEMNKVVFECFFRSKTPLMRKENLSGDTERECLKNGEKGYCLDQQSNVC